MVFYHRTERELSNTSRAAAGVTAVPPIQLPRLLVGPWPFWVCLSYLWKFITWFTYFILSFLQRWSFLSPGSLTYSLVATVRLPVSLVPAIILSRFHSLHGLIVPSFVHSLCLPVNCVLGHGEQVDIFPHLFKYWYRVSFTFLNFWDPLLSHLVISWESSKCLFWNMTPHFPREVSYCTWLALRKSQACSLSVPRWVLQNRFGMNSRAEILQAHSDYYTPICWRSSMN